MLTGSHGGRGGAMRGQFLTDTEAPAYGGLENPSTPGSGGGGAGGGRGGGVIDMYAEDSLMIDGLISANGADAQVKSSLILIQHMAGWRGGVYCL